MDLDAEYRELVEAAATLSAAGAGVVWEGKVETADHGKSRGDDRDGVAENVPTTGRRLADLARQTDASAHAVVTTARVVSSGGLPPHAPVIAKVPLPDRPVRETGHMLTLSELGGAKVGNAGDHAVLAKLVHALVAVLIGLSFLLGHGLIALTFTPEARPVWLGWHQGVGISVLVLLVALAGWRPFWWRPSRSADEPPSERLTGRLCHFGLASLTGLLALSGWLLVSAMAAPQPTRVFGVLTVRPLPALRVITAEERAPFETVFGWLHAGFALALAVMICAHVALVVRGRSSARPANLRAETVIARGRPSPSAGE